MNEKSKLKCPACGHVLTIDFGYDGCDWNSESGEGSGYGHEVGLVCNKCGSFYPIVRYRNFGDVECVKDELKPYNK